MLLALAVLAVGAALALVANLDRPWIKKELRQAAREYGGVELDYGVTRLRGLSALTVEQLVVRSPAAVSMHAPELLRVGRLGVRWAPSMVLLAPPWLVQLELDDVALTVVVDEHGKTSLDALGKPSAAPPRPARPARAKALSQRASASLGDSFPVRHARLAGLTLALVHIRRGTVVERDTLAGLTATLDAAPLARGTRLDLALGEPGAPLALQLRRARPRKPDATAALRVSLVASATPREAQVMLDARVERQDIAPQLAIAVLAQLEARASFAPQQQHTAITISRLELGDGAAVAQASLLVPDTAAPRIIEASGALDARHLGELAHTWVPALRLQSGQLRYRIEQLSLAGPTSRSSAHVDGDLTGVELDVGTGTLSVGAVRLALHARPQAAQLLLDGTASLERLQLEQAGTGTLRGEALTLALSGTQSQAGALSAEATLRFQRITATGARVLTAQQGLLSLRAGAPHGRRPPFALAARLSADRVLVEQDERVLVDLPLELGLALRDLQPDTLRPALCQGTAHLTVQAGALQAALDARRHQDTLTFDLSADGAQLGELAALLPAGAGRRVPWAKMALQLHSKGRIERLTTVEPKLRQRTQLTLIGGSLDDVATRAVALDLTSQGTRWRHEVQADMHIEGLRVDAHELGHDHLTLALSLDRSKPALKLELRNDRLPEALLAGAVSFERKTRTLVYDVSGHLARLAPLSALLSSRHVLSGFDVADLDLELQSAGKLTGVVSSIDARGIRLAPDMLRRAGGSATLEVSGLALRWALDDHAVSIPAATFRAKLQGAGARRTLESELAVGHADVSVDGHQFAASDLVDKATVTLTGGLEGTLEHVQHVTIGALQQPLVPAYVIGNLSASLLAERTGEGLIKISELRVENRAGGTTLALSGGLELTPDERRVSLRTKLQQDLTRFSTRPDTFEGRGRVALDLTLSSPDLRLFHTAAKLQLDGATIRLPREKIALESIDGELPIVSDFLVDGDGVEVLRGAHINPYTAQRFADQHPLLGYRSFVSIASVTTPFVAVAPFAANLEVARNTISLSQLEMGVRGGTITGSGIIEYNGADSIVHANMRASSVHSSHGEPFDGNAALTIGVRERSVEGRADILRIGRRHLTDLLDLQDPLRADASFNQVRTALRFGYPDRVRLSFQHGFASAGVELGGLARLLKLNDVRGIPIGPLMERVMASALPREEP